MSVRREPISIPAIPGADLMPRRYVAARTRYGWAVHDMRLGILVTSSYRERHQARAHAQSLEAKQWPWTSESGGDDDE